MSQDSSSNKTIAHIIYPCFVCGGEYGTAGGVIQHVKNVHGYIIIPRPTGYHRPVDNHYDFANNVRGKWDVQHYGCPCCSFHAPKTDVEDILAHVMKVHHPSRVEGFVQKNEDEEDELYEEQSDQEDAQQDVSEGKENDEDETETEVDNEEGTEENESTGVLSSLLRDEKVFINEVYNMLIETTNMFKKLSGRGTSN